MTILLRAKLFLLASRTYLRYLNKHLSEDVFNKKDRSMIENIRNLLSLSKMHMQCSVSGLHHVANMTYPSFYKASNELRIPELQLIDEGEVRCQFRLFLKLLAQEKLGDSDDSILFKEILMKSEKYTDVSLIIHILSCAAITKSVESIVESWGSQMEELSSKKRGIGEDRLHDEMMICINGPALPHCDKVVLEALGTLKSAYKSAKDRLAGHFVRRSENIELYTVSKVVDRLAKTEVKMPFMV